MLYAALFRKQTKHDFGNFKKSKNLIILFQVIFFSATSLQNIGNHDSPKLPIPCGP